MYKEIFIEKMYRFRHLNGCNPDAVIINPNVLILLEREVMIYPELKVDDSKIKTFMGVELVEGFGDKLFYFYKK